MRTFRDAKIMAKILRSELIHRRQVELSHSECLEIVARQFGHDDWNVMAAKINELSTISGAGDTGPFSAATTTIPVFRVFHVELAQAFYVDFLGFTLDWARPQRRARNPVLRSGLPPRDRPTSDRSHLRPLPRLDGGYLGARSGRAERGGQRPSIPSEDPAAGGVGAGSGG